MKLLHFSDVHLPYSLRRVPLSDWLSKRLLGGANWVLRRRRLFADGRNKIEALVELARSEGVTAVLFTGDYTVLGTDAELAAARDVFTPFLEWNFVGLPGNHDLYLGDVVRERRFERHFGDTMASDLPDLAVDESWPIVRLLGETAAIVAVASARPNPQPWRSSGRVPPPQLEALGAALADTRLAPRFVFVATHYAPRLPDGGPDTREHGLENADALLAAIASLERGALLHGHVHHCYSVARADGPPLFGAGSATCAGREGCWLFEVSEAGATASRGRFQGDTWILDEPTALAPPRGRT